jgi:toxin ParE1/3/4
MKVRYTRQAVADLDDIADYIRTHNPLAAVAVETAVRSTINLLADFPRIGSHRPQLDARALRTPRHLYTVYYRIEGDEVWIVHIRDDRRKPPEPGDL